MNGFAKDIALRKHFAAEQDKKSCRLQGGESGVEEDFLVAPIRVVTCTLDSSAVNVATVTTLEWFGSFRRMRDPGRKSP